MNKEEAYNIITQFIGDSDLDQETKEECQKAVNYLDDKAR